MKTVDEYALAMVLEGAEGRIEDDLNEDGDISDELHQGACYLAHDVVEAIRAHKDEVLAWAKAR